MNKNNFVATAAKDILAGMMAVDSETPVDPEEAVRQALELWGELVEQSIIISEQITESDEEYLTGINFLDANHIVINSNRGIYRCLGSVCSVELGSPVRNEGETISIFDDGIKVSLSLARAPRPLTQDF